jgi:hypothetical protein
MFKKSPSFDTNVVFFLEYIKYCSAEGISHAQYYNHTFKNSIVVNVKSLLNISYQ